MIERLTYIQQQLFPLLCIKERENRNLVLGNTKISSLIEIIITTKHFCLRILPPKGRIVRRLLQRIKGQRLFTSTILSSSSSSPIFKADFYLPRFLPLFLAGHSDPLCPTGLFIAGGHRSASLAGSPSVWPP